MMRYRCRDCGAPIDKSPPKKKSQPATGYCDCADAVWLLATERSPLKLVPRRDRAPALDVLDDRIVALTTQTVPPLARRQRPQ
jgi:hypothetical protein